MSRDASEEEQSVYSRQELAYYELRLLQQQTKTKEKKVKNGLAAKLRKVIFGDANNTSLQKLDEQLKDK